MNKGIELWNRAKKIIPGGSQLLSKRSERFLPGGWPSYYSKAKGIDVWDLDGRKYKDMSIMGVGSCILGYADDDVDSAVKKAVDVGSMCTLNCPEEVELAEKLLKLNPWAQMVRYARTGGEALAIAVRIARAYKKKDKLAFCGYHGWHDWYLAANLADDSNLNGHLMPGLEPAGVPRGLMGTALPFEYNRTDQLEQITEKHDIGIIVVEPIRHHYPKDGFLQKVRKIADDNEAVLLVDETSSAWRKNVGGVHSILGLQPDMAVYGKAMSNGFSMAAVVGKGEIMDATQKSFISSTYWTERVGPTAALATINKLETHDVPAHLKRIGLKIGKGWEKLAAEREIDIEIMFEFEPLIAFNFKDEKLKNAVMTLFTQEMLERGYLAKGGVYCSYSHKDEDVERYLEHVDEVFGILKKAMDEGSVEKKLKGPVHHTGFRRLTT